MSRSQGNRGLLPFVVACTVALFALSACGDDAAPDAAEAAEGPRPAAEAGERARPAAQDPDAFAPKAEPPTGDDPITNMARMFVEAAVVPRRDEVGIPPYPGARVVQVQPASPMSINEVDFEALPVIVLISEDDPAAVAEFYARELAGWNQGEFYLNQAFWEGDGDYDPLDVSGQTTPSVLVMEPVGNRAEIFPGTRSEMQVRYRP